MCEKIKRKELNEIIYNSDIHRQVYVGCEHVKFERFTQIQINGKYIPYIISSFGRIISLKFGKSNNYNVREIKINNNGTKYSKITIHHNNKVYNCWIHRLVAEAFIKHPKKKDEVNHKNGVCSDNYVWNLEWVTHKENVQHAERNHLTNHPKGENIHGSKLKEKDVHKIAKMILQNKSPNYICDKMKISKNIFQTILHKRKWKHVTYIYNFDNYKYLRFKYNGSTTIPKGSTL